MDPNRRAAIDAAFREPLDQGRIIAAIVSLEVDEAMKKTNLASENNISQSAIDTCAQVSVALGSSSKMPPSNSENE